MANDDIFDPTGELAKMQVRDRPPVSPRFQHFAGDVPPTLSPLDAFAAQGRLLAKQFDESRKTGRRLSRLPPSSVMRSLSQPRSPFSRTFSEEDTRIAESNPGVHEQSGGGDGISGEVGVGDGEGRGGFSGSGGMKIEEPAFRPQSQYPRLSGFPKRDSDLGNRGQWDKSYNSNSHSYFGAPRAESPEQAPSLRSNVEADRQAPVKPTEIAGLGVTRPRQQSSGDPSTRYYASKNLAPPNTSAPRTSHSPASGHPESSDDDYYTSSNAGSSYSKPRKMSSSSGMSMPYSPMSQPARSHPRSPSPNSEASGTPHQYQRPSFNFSRPLSRSSTTLSLPITSTPSQKASEPTSRGMERGNKPAPITVPKLSRSTTTQELSEPSSTANSYIYAKYSLPRGRLIERNSLVFSGLQTPNFEWKEPLFESTPPSSAVQENFARTPSPPPVRPAFPTASPKSLQKSSPAPNSPVPKPSPSQTPPQPVKTMKRVEQSPSMSRRRSFDQNTGEALSVAHPHASKGGESSNLKVKKDEDDSKSISARSERTVRPRTSRIESNNKPRAQMTADEHVDKGIACHESGSLNESTYHLRVAAMQNHPTGMLMYALACRHGWGMRPNQQEGVKWLRKAVDSAGLDLNNEGGTAIQARGKDIHEQKTRQAQFALSIYELGVSHLNGWGIDQDKGLALRCFEISGHWGDIDALAEAGYCYAEGIGCKKDLMKAAKYYRMAEGKGMSMVGNSWIYKDKYKNDDSALPTPSLRSASGEKKPVNKSRARSIFGRKKSTTPHDES